jgi:hypothetical protein
VKGGRAPLHFFALVSHAGAIVPRLVPLSRALQGELSEVFVQQRGALLDGRERIRYQPGYRPEGDELFRIREHTLPAPLVDAIQHPDRCPELDGLDVEAMAVRALLGARPALPGAGVQALFQRFDARQVLVRKRVLLLSDGVFEQPAGSGLAIATSLAAVHEDGELLFESEHAVKRFLDLADVYDEATDAQVGAFVRAPLFVASDWASLVSLFDKPMRARVAQILHDRILEQVDAKDCARVAAKYGMRLTISRGKVVLPTAKPELRALVRILVDEYYEGELTGLQYVANSKRKLS